MDDGSNTNSQSSNIVSANNAANNTKPNNRCNLIVNYLPQSLKEHDFNLLFSKIGPLKTCKLMFDRQTGYSFGYGFVEYVNEEDALKAIDTLNGYQIEHKRLKVALARPNCEDTKNTNLYIRNIPLSFDEQLLHELFSQYGEVIQVRLLRDQNTAFSRRIGFIIMATKQMAQTAIQHLDNTIPPNGGSEPIYVKYADEEGKKRHGPGGNSGGNMRMNNQAIMSQQQQQQQQQHHQNNYQNSNNYLSQQSAHGFNFNNPNSFMMSNNNQNAGLNPLVANNLQNLGKMKTNRSSGHQNRYNPIGGTGAAVGGLNTQVGGMNNAGLNATNPGAPVSNYNPWNMNMAAAAAVIQQPYSQFGGSNQNNIVDVTGIGIGAGNLGMPMDTSKSGGMGNSGAGNSGHIIYVYGIGQANESDLYSLFSNCGRILRVNVIKNQKTGQSKGYGFVVFETYEEAYYAVHNMNGYMYNHRPLQVQLNAGHLD